jgi:hypothetical protein
MCSPEATKRAGPFGPAASVGALLDDEERPGKVATTIALITAKEKAAAP